MPDSYPVLFGRALAQSIHDSTIGFYKNSGAYTPAEATLARPAVLIGDDFPTSIDNCIVLKELDPISDGRANLTWRYQVLSRLKGTKTEARNLAWNLRVLLDHRQNIPPGFNVSWVWEFSQLGFTADTQGRHSTAQTIYFRGRRPL